MPHTGGGMRRALCTVAGRPHRPGKNCIPYLRNAVAATTPRQHMLAHPGRASPVTPHSDPCRAFAGRCRRSSVSEAAVCGTVLATLGPNPMAVRPSMQDKFDETRPRSLVFERVLAACRNWHSDPGSGLFAGIAGDRPCHRSLVRPIRRRTSL